MDEIINAIGTIRSHLATQEKTTRELALAITKLDEAMLWLGVEAGKPLIEDEPEIGDTIGEN